MADASEHRGRAAGDNMEMSNSYRALQIMLTILDINLRAMVGYSIFKILKKQYSEAG